MMHIVCTQDFQNRWTSTIFYDALKAAAFIEINSFGVQCIEIAGYRFVGDIPTAEELNEWLALQTEATNE